MFHNLYRYQDTDLQVNGARHTSLNNARESAGASGENFSYVWLGVLQIENNVCVAVHPPIKPRKDGWWSCSVGWQDNLVHFYSKDNSWYYHPKEDKAIHNLKITPIVWVKE